MVKLKSLCQACLDNKSWLNWSTRQTTERAFEYFSLAVGNLTIDRISSLHIGALKKWLHQGRSAASVNMYIRAIRAVFNWAVEQELLEYNPFSGVKLFKTPRKHKKRYNNDEFQKVMESCKTTIWRARILVGKTTGMRRGAVLNLTIDDIDFVNGVIHVQPKRETKTTWWWMPKDKERRPVPLIDEVAVLFRELIRCSPNKPYLLLTDRVYRNNMRLKKAGILSDRIRRCPYENFNRDFRRILNRAGVKATFHDLRRTFATEMVNEVNPADLMKLMGLSDMSTLVTYYLVYDESTCRRAGQYASALLKQGVSPESRYPKRKAM